MWDPFPCVRGDLCKVLSAHLGRGCIRLLQKADDGWCSGERDNGTESPAGRGRAPAHGTVRATTVPDTVPGPWAREELAPPLPRTLPSPETLNLHGGRMWRPGVPVVLLQSHTVVNCKVWQQCHLVHSNLPGPTPVKGHSTHSK